MRQLLPVSQDHTDRVQPRVLAQLTASELRQMQVPLDERLWPSGRMLCIAGERASSVFAITWGTVKLVRTSADGRQRIVRLLQAGDVVGIEALACDHYDNDAITMTEANLLRIPVSALHALSARLPDLQSGLMHKWHQALKGADDWLAELNAGPAGARVRHFILRMRHTTDPSMVTLFSREDMGAMMGLKLETVSRELSALVRDGLIERIDRLGRQYRILDSAKLMANA